jgi:hypothetical protein
MSIRNQNWYNLQSTRRYPLDDNSTGIDDAGNLIRDDILVDCNIRFPNTYGKYAYVQGITVSPGLATVLIGAIDNLTGVTGTTIAAVSVTRPVESNVNYAVTGLVPGVHGWITFGPGVEHSFVGRYATAQQSLLNPRNAKTYRPLPIPSIKKLQLNTALQNIVRLSGALPVKVHYVENAGDVIDMTTLNPATREPKLVRAGISAIVVELDLSQRTETYDPLRAFLGPCAQRPESGTCPEIPIENINGVAPDCDGNIDIIIDGFESREFVDCGGVDVLTDLDLPVVCEAVRDPIGDPDTDGGGGGGANKCCVPDRIVADEIELRTIDQEERFIGMLVKTLDTNEFWTLKTNFNDWEPAPAEADCGFPDPLQPRVGEYPPPDLPPIGPADELTGNTANAAVIPDIVIDQTSAGSRQSYPCMLLPVCWDFVGCPYPDISYSPPFQTTFGGFELVAKNAPAICPCEHMRGPENLGAVEADKAYQIFQQSAQYSQHAVYASTNLAGPSMAHLQNCATDWSVNKTISVEFSLDYIYGQRVGGLFLNYSTQYDAAGTPVTQYIAVVYDAKDNQIKVLRYRYLSPTLEASVPFQLPSGAWCQLHVTPTINGENILLAVTAKSSNTDDLTTLYVTIPLTRYGDVTGFTGLFADRSRVYFNKFAIMDNYYIIIDDSGLLPP